MTQNITEENKMKIFNDYVEAIDFAQLMLEDMEADEYLLIMKKGNRFNVIGDYEYTEVKNRGWELVSQHWN